jgi:hypothetical protein
MENANGGTDGNNFLWLIILGNSNSNSSGN